MLHFPILLAEDDPVTRKLLEKTLVKAGHKVIAVENGRKALEVFKKAFFPIVLTDWMMPEMDGLELCKAIRKDASKGYVFIVLLTARDSKNDIVSGLEAGADDYLIKPPNNAELIARIKTGIRILELEKSLKKANEEIRILSITDPLTGIYNRGYLNQQLAQEIEKAKRYKRFLSLILCDIDHFKKVNDTYGHQVGDQVLKECVQCIKETIRHNVDWVVRYGGEEFIIVLPETDLKSACSVAERIRYVIAKRIIKVQNKVIHITVSFGVNSIDSTIHDNKISSNTIINEADKCLYLAKQEGRNRVKASGM